MKLTSLREWFWAAFIAFLLTILVRTFLIEAFTIPTSSMEKTLLVGDNLIVNKFVYGLRLPVTPFSLPFSHNTLPFGWGKSYIDCCKLPYIRLPKISNIKRQDVVVFNYPMDKSRPLDKRDHFIKRCVALPGDTLVLVNRRIYINNKEESQPEFLQFNYFLRTDGTPINSQILTDYNITEGGLRTEKGDLYEYALTASQIEKVKSIPNIIKIDSIIRDKGVRNPHEQVFPNDFENFPWNIDNYGPVVIPEKGATIDLTLQNLSLFSYLIEHHEGNTILVSNNKILINGVIAEKYTFRKDYYFMMGDNRQNSQDSRIWGFVPEDHIVGKAILVWMSVKPGGKFPKDLRWDRVFKRVK
ncbi:MAG: signal peptidase I [Sphingobacteriales bacterium]|nr:MAG: signal peptidase I [Sphingobacteriales bacterium]